MEGSEIPATRLISEYSGETHRIPTEMKAAKVSINMRKQLEVPAETHENINTFYLDAPAKENFVNVKLKQTKQEL